MSRPDISVVISARNEGARLAPTIQSIARARTTDARVEFVIVDDASTDGTIPNLVAKMPELLNERSIIIRVSRLKDRAGIFRARNHAVSLAKADIIFGTDAHVRFSRGWDEIVFQNMAPNRVLAGTTIEKGSSFQGYGCHLLVPGMNTSWNSGPIDRIARVPIAVDHAMVTTRELFNRLGGYDSGMIMHGAGEPEFSVRAWLHGAEVVAIEDLKVEHRFKPKDELAKFVSAARPSLVHNSLRFGLLYLSELGCLQLLRFYARSYPAVFQEALRQVDQSDVWERRSHLEKRQQRSFEWFVDYFGIKNQLGGEVI
jgi:glycosyltransferase involved in cell wall biosynthesis